MIIYDVKQGSKEWNSLRLGKVTGSRLKELMAKDNLPLIDDLIAEIISEQQEDLYVNSKMQRGTDLEPVARTAYESLTGYEVEEIGFIQSENYDWFGVSPDGLIKIKDKYPKAIEIKCPDTCTHVRYIRQNKLPNEYKYQIYSYFIANEDLEVLDFVSYDDRFKIKPLHIIPINRGEIQLELEETKQSMIKFWDKFLKYYSEITS